MEDLRIAAAKEYPELRSSAQIAEHKEIRNRTISILGSIAFAVTLFIMLPGSLKAFSFLITVTLDFVLAITAVVKEWDY